jgi:antitoxin (DNA-binding transcriptional repressor) of toxin-antitoxin stability system
MELNTFERMYADELYEAVDRAEQGSHTQITKAGKPVAWIIPVTGKPGTYLADEVVAGLVRIAKAAGIYEQVLPAGSLNAVFDMIAAWCQVRRDAAPASPGVLAEAIEESNKRWTGG